MRCFVTKVDSFIVWGRPDSSAVSRVMWALAELELPFERIDWGGAFGGNDHPAHLARNPAGTIPAIALPDGRTLWESQAIVRCLCALYAEGKMIPSDPVERAKAEAIMDWSGAFARAVSAVRDAYKQSGATIESCKAPTEAMERQLAILDRILGARSFAGGEFFGIADFALGGWLHRLMRCPEELRLPISSIALTYYDRLCTRKPYQDHILAKLSSGTQRLGG